MAHSLWFGKHNHCEAEWEENCHWLVKSCSMRMFLWGLKNKLLCGFYLRSCTTGKKAILLNWEFIAISIKKFFTNISLRKKWMLLPWILLLWGLFCTLASGSDEGAAPRAFTWSNSAEGHSFLLLWEGKQAWHWYDHPSRPHSLISFGTESTFNMFSGVSTKISYIHIFFTTYLK